MKLWEEPESRSAEKMEPPMVTPTCRVSVKRTPAMAEREKHGGGGGRRSAGSRYQVVKGVGS